MPLLLLVVVIALMSAAFCLLTGNSDIIVATPGRLLAHLQETRGFAEQCQATKVLVMDEADRLLDMGFKR